MRERIAMLVASLAVCFAVFMSALFASRHNAAPTRSRETSSGEASSLFDTGIVYQAESLDVQTPERLTGARVYEVQRCATCHSIAGIGNPRSPLDGVGGRMARTELRNAIIASGPAANKLPKPVRLRKARYAQLSEAEMTNLFGLPGNANNQAKLKSVGNDDSFLSLASQIRAGLCQLTQCAQTEDCHNAIL